MAKGDWIALERGTTPNGLVVRVAEDGTVNIGNDTLSPEAYAKMDAFVRCNPHFKTCSKKAPKERLTEDV